ncbi:MAG TPA: PLP-dependent aminotransferase family protein [Bryobacteraceae bacterium]|nr:PLP-dependent aminotransferase family protein [Bryobacteraceae bacterium]
MAARRKAIELYEELRKGIRSGLLASGSALPPTRVLAAEYGLSRGTVVAVYEQLRAEGYVRSHGGAGTFVNVWLPEDLLEAGTRGGSLPPAAKIPAKARPAARPFRSQEPAMDEFPMKIWAALAGRRLRRGERELMEPGDPGGYGPLREAVRQYIGSSRGVYCQTSQVVIVSGIQQALDLCARLLLRPGDEAWVEDPGYPSAARAFARAGATVRGVPVDSLGVRIEEAVRLCPSAKLAYVTPAHQFPLGPTMPAARRLDLLRWARESGARIIEDDYDSEFRYEGRPVPAMQGLDRQGLVVYMGTFNKVLFPGLRLAYVVLPESLTEIFLRLRTECDLYAPVFSQMVLTDFIAEGHFMRHLRRLREIYARRLEALEQACARHLQGLVRLPKVQAGLHTPAYVQGRWTSETAEKACFDVGLECYGLHRFAVEHKAPEGFLLGFGAFTERRLATAVQKLAAVLR